MSECFDLTLFNLKSCNLAFTPSVYFLPQSLAILWFFFSTKAIEDDVQNHSPVYDFFIASADALANACAETNITAGLDTIKMLNHELENRWQVVTSVITEKQQHLTETEKQLQQYIVTKEHLDDLLCHAEGAIASQTAPGADLEKARVNRNTVKVKSNISYIFCLLQIPILCIGERFKRDLLGGKIEEAKSVPKALWRKKIFFWDWTDYSC